jgi:hypothetical protein
MALIKSMTLENGIIVNYHRVVSVTNITNHETIIEVASYTSKSKREEEKTALKENKPMNVYIFTNRLSLPYSQTLDVSEAYEYMKTLEDFDGAKND